MVQDDEWVGLDGVRVVFDDDRVASDAGIVLVATLAGRLGIEALLGRFVGLGRDRPGAALIHFPRYPPPHVQRLFEIVKLIVAA